MGFGSTKRGEGVVSVAGFGVSAGNGHEQERCGVETEVRTAAGESGFGAIGAESGLADIGTLQREDA